MRQELLPEFKPFEQPVIAHDKVRYVGEPIAVVLADSAALAEDALDAIALDIEPLPRGRRPRTPRASDESLLFEAAGSNRALTLTGSARRCRCCLPRRAPTPAASTSRCSASRRRADGAARAACRMGRGGAASSPCHGAAKVAFHNRRILAKQMDLPKTPSP